jgi:hypothetical protein
MSVREETYESRMRVMYRCWYGYTRLFKGQKIKLDDEDVPIFRVPDLTTGKNRFLAKNMKSLLRSIHSDMFPLYFVGIGVRRLGVLPDPFKELSINEISTMKKQHDDFIRLLANLRSECFELFKKKLTYEDLREAIVKGDVSVPAAAVYAAKHGSERFDIGSEKLGLVMESVTNVFDLCIRLQKENFFFTRNVMIAERMVKLWEDMEF